MLKNAESVSVKGREIMQESQDTTGFSRVVLQFDRYRMKNRKEDTTDFSRVEFQFLRVS